jgi:hypothetical protein
VRQEYWSPVPKSWSINYAMKPELFNSESLKYL